LSFCAIWLLFGCQYQCNRLAGKTRSRNELLCVEWDVKLYTLTHLVCLSIERNLCLCCFTNAARQWCRKILLTLCKLYKIWWVDSHKNQ